MPKQSLCIFKVVIFEVPRSMGYSFMLRLHQIDLLFHIIVMQRASCTTLNKPAQNWKKKYHKTLFSQKKGSVFWQGNFLEDYLSQYRIDCASEDCLSHR